MPAALKTECRYSGLLLSDTAALLEMEIAVDQLLMPLFVSCVA